MGARLTSSRADSRLPAVREGGRAAPRLATDAAPGVHGCCETGAVMTLKSISLAAVLVGAMFLVGCGDDEASGPTNSVPVANSIAPVIIDTAVDPIPFSIPLKAKDWDGDPLKYHVDATSDQGGTVTGGKNALYTPEPSWVTAGEGSTTSRSTSPTPGASAATL